jgi:hypothetical protein
MSDAPEMNKQHQANDLPGLDFKLWPDAFGIWHLKLGDQTHEHVIAVRAFPIAAPMEGVSILSREGKELLWLESLMHVPHEAQQHLEQCLQNREFMPEITKLDAVNSFVTPSRWCVQTTRGPTELLLKGEEDIKRLNANTLIVSDAYGVQFLIKDLSSLDRQSRKFMDRFL